MSKMAKTNRSKSRRTTPWDESTHPTPVQRFIKMHYQTRYEERHQPLDETGEAEMINSFEPKHCPFCESESFIKYGHDRNGINRYKCTCGKLFKPTTDTIFDSRKIGICEWIEYCLNIFRYVSLNADSWNNRNAISTSKYWLEKLFLTLENTQNNVVLSGTVWLDETYYSLMTVFVTKMGTYCVGYPAIRYVLALQRIRSIQYALLRALESRHRNAAMIRSKTILHLVQL